MEEQYSSSHLGNDDPGVHTEEKILKWRITLYSIGQVLIQDVEDNKEYLTNRLNRKGIVKESIKIHKKD